MSVNVVIKSIFDNKGIQQAQKQFAAIGKDIGRLAVGIGSGLALGTVATAKFASSAIKAAEGVAQANNRLAQVNESMGLFGSGTERVTQRLVAFAEANEMTVAVDAEVIKATQAKLLTFKELAGTADETGGAFDRATMAALDLAAAGFGTAETNAIQLGKALQDPVKGLSALRRSGITFTEQEKEKIKTLVESNKTLEAQDLILKAIETQVGGTAEATAKGTDKIKLAFDNVLESAGTALMPAFDELADTLTNNVAPALTDLATEVGPILVDTILLLSDVLKQATDANTPLGRSIDGVSDSFTLLFDTIAGGRSDLESTTDTLGMLADALNFILVTGAGLVAFFQGVGIAAKAFAEGDLKTYFDFLFTDPIVFIQNQAKVREAAAAVDSAFTDAAGSARRLNDIDLARARVQINLTEKAVGSLKGALSASAGEANRFQNLLNNTNKPLAPVVTTTTKNTTKKEVESVEDRFKKVQEVIKKAQKAIAKAEKDYETTRFNIIEEARDRREKLEEQAAIRQVEIINESKARLTGAFASAARISLGDLFDKKTTTQIETQVKKLSATLSLSVSKETEKTVYSSVDSIVSGLRDRLAASKQLLANASQLASEGFSQTFIEQVIETGADTGNALADAILGATPETKAEMRRLFNELETVSETGMDALAQNVYDKFGLATRALAAESKKVRDELAIAVAEENARLREALLGAAVAFSVSMDEIKTTFLEDLKEFGGAFAGLKGTIKELLDEIDRLKGKATADMQAAVTIPNAPAVLANAQIIENVKIQDIGRAGGIVVDSMADVAGTVAYIQARIKAAETYIKSSSSNALQEASARNQIKGFTAELANVRTAAATGVATPTVININVKTDTTQSQAMVGKTIGNIVTKYVTTGGQVLVSGQ